MQREISFYSDRLERTFPAFGRCLAGELRLQCPMGGNKLPI